MKAHVGPILALALQPLTLLAQDNLLMVGGNLVLQSRGRRVVLKALAAPDEFQGYALLPNRQVFVAYYNPESGEASSFLSILDPASAHETHLAELGGTGESRFVYEPLSERVLFNWFDGLYVFSLPAAVKNAASGEKRRDFASILVQVGAVSCVDPAWQTAALATCRELHIDGSSTLLQVSLWPPR